MWTFIILSIIFIALLLLLLKYFDNQTKDYFESKGILYQGNGAYRLLLNLFKGIGVIDDSQNEYRRLKGLGVKIAGANNFGMTTLVVQDPDLLRSIFVKDFHHFENRSILTVPKTDVLFGKMLFVLRGQTWKELRIKMTPTFTTGKIKRLFPLFDQSGKKLVKYLQQEIAANQEGTNAEQNGEIDLNEGYSKFTMDVIASAVMGIDSQVWDQKEPGLFERMGMKLQLSFGVRVLLKMIVMMSLPKVADWLGLSFFEKEVQDFFQVAIKASIHARQEKNVKQNDFIQLMLEARENKLKTDDAELDNFDKDAIILKQETETSNEKPTSSLDDSLDDDGVVANAMLFFLAGYDTVQSLLIFCAYSLALHPEIQDKLRAEVEFVLDENGGEFSYDAIMNKMTYLDSVINETLRFYPPNHLTDRACTLDYPVAGTDFVLKKGQGMIVSILGVHHDEEYYPEPEKFDPDRFSPENKGKINPYVFLPWGSGPRSCIGRRFALAEAKVAIAHLVHNFKIEPSKRTPIPMKYAKTTTLKPEAKMFLSLTKIEH